MSTKSLVNYRSGSLMNLRKNSTATNLQVVGGVGLIVWLGVNIIPFFPLLMALLVLAGVVMKVRS